MKKILTILLLITSPILFGQRISELPATTTAANGNLFLIVQGGVTKKIDFQYLQTALADIPVSMSGDTLFIGTDTLILGAGIYVSYECDPVMNSGTRLNGDTVFINTCYVHDIEVTDHPQFPVEYLRYEVNSAWDTVTKLIKPHGIMSGGQVTWLSDTTFIAEPCLYFIYGDMYYTPSITLLISSGDPTDPRIDIVVASNDTTISVIEGVPSADPAKPQVDPTTQLELTQIYVPAGTTTFEEIYDQEIIYNENIEWTGSASGVTVDFASVTSPYLGTKCANVGTVTSGDEIIFTNGATILADQYDVLSFAIKLKAVMSRGDNLIVQFYDGSLAASSALVTSINKSILTWQTYTIDLNDFTWNHGEYDKLVFRFIKSGGSHSGFYLDYTKVEVSTEAPVFDNGIVLTGDVTGSGITGVPVNTTLATVNSKVGTYGSADTTLTITVDAKGRITDIVKNAISGLPASALEWSDTTKVNGVGIATYDDLRTGPFNGSLGATTPNSIIGTTIQANTGFVPDATDGAYLGTASAQFSNLFLAEGGVINWDNGDATITQAGNVVTIAGANVVVDAATFNKSAGYDAVPSNTPSSNAVTIDWTAGNVQALVYNDTCNFTFTAPPLPCHLTLIMTHANNTTEFPCTWPSGANGVVWAGGTAITPTATSNAVDIVSFFYNGTKYYAMFGNDFK